MYPLLLSNQLECVQLTFITFKSTYPSMYLLVRKFYQILMHDSMQRSSSLLLYLLSFSLYTAPGRVRDLKVQVKDENKMSVLTWKKPKNGGKVDKYRVYYL